MDGRMKAAVYHKPGDIKLETVDIPKIGPRDVLVKVEVVLTCGTDLKMYKVGHPLTKPPMIIGHEFSGRIVKIGGEVVGFRKGMRVVAANTAPCNTCYYCKRGKPNLCENLSENVIGFSIPGAYAEYIKIPARIVQQNMYEVPRHVSFEEAALLEPLACVVHGVELADIGLGERVAIIGAGPIGLLHLQLAKIKGAREVIVSDLSNLRLENARKLGADCLVDASKVDQVEEVRKLTGGRGAEVVIEAVGSPETWRKAVQMTGKGGRIILFGGCPSGSTVPFDAGTVHYGELTIKGVFHHTPHCVEKALSLISSGAIKAKEFITQEMPLSRVEEGLKSMAQGKAIKVAIHP